MLAAVGPKRFVASRHAAVPRGIPAWICEAVPARTRSCGVTMEAYRFTMLGCVPGTHRTRTAESDATVLRTVLVDKIIERSDHSSSIRSSPTGGSGSSAACVQNSPEQGYHHGLIARAGVAAWLVTTAVKRDMGVGCYFYQHHYSISSLHD